MSLIIAPAGHAGPSLSDILTTTLHSVGEGSRSAYSRNLQEFLTWWHGSGEKSAYAGVVKYLSYLQEDRKLATATVNQHLSAARVFFKTAYLMGSIEERVYRSIKEIPNVRMQGQRHGIWLSYDQAQVLLDAPDRTTLKGARDRAILGVLIGCMLRRSEVAGLCWGHLYFQDGTGTWLLRDIHGKHNRVRTVPLPDWANARIGTMDCREVDAFGYQDRSDEKPMFYHIDRHGHYREPLTAHGIWQIVKSYADPLGFSDLAPHDLRRTGAELFLRSGGSMRDLQLILGHASPGTTERYLAKDINFEAAAQVVQFDKAVSSRVGIN